MAAQQGTGLSTHIWNNNLRCMILLALYPILILCVFWVAVWALGSASGNYSQGHTGNAFGMAGSLTYDFWPIILSGVAMWFLISWFFHTAMIRKLARSHPVSRSDEPELYNLLENLCISQGMKMPHLEIIETHARNAFASGISEKSFAVTVTRGLMNSLSKDELEAVLAHELAHIQNRDVRLLIVTIIFTGLFGFLAQMIWSVVRYNIFFTAGRRDKNGGGLIIAMLIIMAVLWLGYLASLVMRFAISRKREYMADAGAISMTKNPEAMMRALMRISGKDRIPESTDDIAMMCIENHVPFMGVFATHPPIKKRIKAISITTGTEMPDSASLPPINKAERIESASSREKRPNPWLIRGRRD